MMDGVRWLLVLFVASCVESSSVDCGGQVCAEGTTCRLLTNPDVQVCATQAQLDACDPAAMDGSCALSGVATARCYDGVCLPSGCGNQRMDPGEQCDDGNLAAADGCSADCRSLETCGNAVIDVLQGETCDDGNRFSHDGCTSMCGLERLSWEQSLLDLPRARERAGMAYDPIRRQVVMFGGNRTTSGGEFETDETWIWNGFAWQHMLPPISPPARAGVSMAYDATRDRVVMFGGRVDGIDLGDTWEWDGTTWTVRESTFAPAPRAAHAMTYDDSRNLVALFGGESYGHAPLDDVWEWDGLEWLPHHQIQRPPARARHSFVFDPMRGVSVAFGGDDVDSTQVFGDTWEWNGTSWTMRADAPSIARTNHGSTFDVATQRVVSTGGVGADGATSNEVLSWSGTAWQILSTSTLPRRSAHMLAADTDRKRLVQFGGRDDNNMLVNATHELSGTTWQAAPSGQFTARHAVAGAYDELRHRGVVFGGADTNNVTKFNDTWEIVGGTMARRAPSTQSPFSPSARVGATMAYDSARRQTVLFGGDSTGPQQDTWIWDGVIWSPRTIAAPPPARFASAMAFDRARGKLVMFGGGAFNSFLADTWEWDGVAWTQRAMGGAVAPPARRGASMAYDPIAKVLVLFAGEGESGFLDDTWIWDGTAWTPRAPAVKPQNRAFAGLAFSGNRGRLVLFGGRRSGPAVLNDAWEWDGAGWSRLVVPGTPPARHGHALISTDDGSGVTAVGGAQLEGTGLPRALGDLWRLRWTRDAAADELCRDDRDRDGDMLGGCTDLDCWYACTPLCTPSATCASDAPRCGDQTCDAFETCTLCPGDCGACPVVCGDHVCSPGETCPGDC